MKNKLVLSKLCAIGLLSALCYVGFMFIKINIPTPAGSTAIHFGNTFCVLGALLLGLHSAMIGTTAAKGSSFQNCCPHYFKGCVFV